ncbi:hypothetical protein HN832_01375 [archaeon]|jgi:hypothetical protein|nr:hypothetical protein [archaeon]MBT4373042.1 hypothetical protein [archaeon]MBT4531387.1 hypothetical protein [archaeon]MBT7282042.1 hypothetical protein [archaeon]
MVKEPIKHSTYLALITSILSIILSFLGEIDLQMVMLLFTLTMTAIAFAFFSYYSKQIKSNSEEIKELKRKINIDRRLTKLEIKVFKK